jgi:hypothetical protein
MGRAKGNAYVDYSGGNRQSVPKAFRAKTEDIMPGVQIPKGRELIWTTLWDWRSFAAATPIVNDMDFFDLGSAGRDEARTNVNLIRKLGQGRTFMATHFGVYVISTEASAQLQISELREFRLGMAKIMLGNKVYTTFPLIKCVVASEDGDVGANAVTSCLVKLNNGLPYRLKVPIELNPLEEWFVRLHWETLPTALAGSDTLEIFVVFDGGIVRPLR